MASLIALNLCNHLPRRTSSCSSPFFSAEFSVRASIGPDMPIAITFDHHGYITPKMCSFANIDVSYRIPPRRYARIGQLSGAILQRHPPARDEGRDSTTQPACTAEIAKAYKAGKGPIIADYADNPGGGAYAIRLIWSRCC